MASRVGKYSEINKEIQVDCRKAKEKYIKSQCNEIEKMGIQFRLREMHNKIKLVTGRTKRRLKTKVEKFFLIASN